MFTLSSIRACRIKVSSRSLQGKTHACRETRIDTDHIARSFPLSQEIDANAAPAFSAKSMDLFACRKRVILHVVPSTDPFNIFALRENRQITVAFTNTAVATLHWEMPTFLLYQVWMGEAEAHGTLFLHSVKEPSFVASRPVYIRTR